MRSLRRARVTSSLEKKRLRDLDRQRLVELGRAHELVRRAFGRYVSEEVAASILQSPEGLELGGEEREVTILMSDLRGFTALAARLTPHQVIEFLNLYLEAMVDVIGRVLGHELRVVQDDARVRPERSEVMELCADASVARGLGWIPETSFEDGVREVVQFIRANGRESVGSGAGYRI